MSKANNKSMIEALIDAEVQKMIAKLPAEIFAHGVLSASKNFVFSHSQVVSIAQAALDEGHSRLKEATPFAGSSGTNP